jgi:MFS family permease
MVNVAALRSIGIVAGSATIGAVVGWLLLGDDWPWGAIGAAVVAWGVLAAKARRKRTEDLPIVARELGMDYEEDARVIFDRHPGLRDVSVFDDLFRAEALYSGTRHGLTVAVFDLTTESNEPGSEGGSRDHRTVAVVPGLGLPGFEVTPKKQGAGMVVRGLGISGLHLDPGAADDLEHAEVVDQFRRNYFVFASPQQGSSDEVPPSVDELARVRRLFSVEVMARLVEWPGYLLNCEGGHLVLSRFHGPLNDFFLPVAWRERLGEDAGAIAAGMAAAHESSAPLIVLASDRASARKTDKSRLTWGCLRIVIGLILGFFGGIAIGLALFFASPELAGWLFPVMFFGGPIVGVVLAGLLNSALSSS